MIKRNIDSIGRPDAKQIEIAEKALIGIILLENNLMDKIVYSGLDYRHFNSKFGVLYFIIRNLFTNSTDDKPFKVDTVILYEMLKTKPLLVPDYNISAVELSMLSQDAPISSNMILTASICIHTIMTGYVFRELNRSIKGLENCITECNCVTGNIDEMLLNVKQTN